MLYQSPVARAHNVLAPIDDTVLLEQTTRVLRMRSDVFGQLALRSR